MAPEPKFTHDPDAWGLPELGPLTKASLGINITQIPLSDHERQETAQALTFTSLMIEDGNPEYAKELRGLAGLFRDGAFEPFDSPFAARFFQVTRERDEAIKLAREANAMLRALAGQLEALIGPVDA